MPFLNTCIRESVALREAQSLQKSLLEYAPRCNAVLDYEQLAEELLAGRLGIDG